MVIVDSWLGRLTSGCFGHELAGPSGTTQTGSSEGAGRRRGGKTSTSTGQTAALRGFRTTSTVPSFAPDRKRKEIFRSPNFPM
jgi:hypothetical protein